MNKIYYNNKMTYDNDYYPVDNDVVSCSNSEAMKRELEKVKQMDRGYNKLWRKIPKKNGELKRTKVEAYTTSGFGNHIRDAETGEYYPYLVGTADEDLFFSIILATGECTSRNGSSTLFYLSPERYMQHQNQKLDEKIILRWKQKKDLRMREKNMEKKQTLSDFVEVK
jgi:hypothetical protein